MLREIFKKLEQQDEGARRSDPVIVQIQSAIRRNATAGLFLCFGGEDES